MRVAVTDWVSVGRLLAQEVPRAVEGAEGDVPQRVLHPPPRLRPSNVVRTSKVAAVVRGTTHALSNQLR